ncbi:MAG TPA: SBBP repeat-containing protein, partial [Chloroflexota bacterium]|nr:SBBP repeat-containing protein [Chloroflexota bacterium]
MAVDGSGNAYVTGLTQSTNFPTVNPLQAHLAGGENAFVSMLDSSGTALLYSTYLGGSSNDSANGIAVDASGAAYVTGMTQSTNFPTVNALQPSYAGSEDAFVSKLNPAGNALDYSTFLGGSSSDWASGIAVDASGAAYVAGYTESAGFPTVNALQPHLAGTENAFVSKLNPAGSALVYSTYLGGSSYDSANGIAVDSGGNSYVAGATSSANFPTVNALQTSMAGWRNAFVSKLNASGSALVYSTYLGGNSSDVASGIAVDASGAAYVAGYTVSTNFPTVNALQAHLAGGENAFVSKLDPAGSSLMYSTYLGGSSSDLANGIASDNSGNAYVAGLTESTNFPTANPMQAYLSGTADAFVAKLGTASGSIPWHPRFKAQFASGLQVSVDLADGHVDIGASDMSIPGRGLDLTLGHTWDSTLAIANQVTSAGQGWSTDLTPSMTGSLTETVVYHDATGAAWPFTYTGPYSATGTLTSYNAPPGLPWQLSTTTITGTATYTLTDVLTGAMATFNGQGQLVANTDSYGNSNTAAYSGGLATSWTNSGGRALNLGYGNGLLSSAQSPLWESSGGSQGQQVTYGYAGNQLTSLTRGAGTADASTSQFGYDGTLLTSVTTPMSQSWTLGYNAAGQLTSLTSPISGTLGQAGYTPASTTTFSYGAGQTQVIEAAGTTQALTTTYTLDAEGDPTIVKDGAGDATTTTYNTCHEPLTIRDPNGNTTTNHYLSLPTVTCAGVVSEVDEPGQWMNYPSPYPISET